MVVVEVFLAVGDGPHHTVLSLILVFGFAVEFPSRSSCGRDWVNVADEGVWKLELLVTTQQKEEEAPEDAAQSTNKTKYNVEGLDSEHDMVSDSRLDIIYSYQGLVALIKFIYTNGLIILVVYKKFWEVDYFDVWSV